MTDPFVGTSTSPFAAPSNAPQYFDATEVESLGDPYDPNLDVLPAAESSNVEQPSFSPASLDAGRAPIGGSDGDQTVLRARRRWRLLPRTLGNRLVVGVVALIVLVVASGGVATYIALSSFLTGRLNQQLSTASAAMSANASLRTFVHCIDIDPEPCPITYGPGGNNGFGAGARASAQLWLGVLSPQGDALPLTSDSSELMILSLGSNQRAAIASSPATYRALTTSSGSTVLVTARQIPTTAGNYLLLVGISADEKINTLHTLLVTELLIGAGAVLLAFLATSVGVRLSLRPLHRVTNTARAVTAELSPEGAGLDRRVQVTDSDTEVGQLATSVNTLLGAVETQFAARLESENRMRQFMADASHELRTPLTSIRGYAELARMRRALDPDREPGTHDSDADAMDRIESEGTRMSRLVDDLLTLARGDIGAPIETVYIDVSELIDDAVDGVRAAYPTRPIEVDAEPGISIYGDHDQLLRAVRNLVMNAAVHTAPNGPIWVTTHRDFDHVLLQVRDSGPGLPPEQAAHVFERFWRSDSSRARTSGGSGLGLSIVASIVQAHGGRVYFDSSVDGGSTVTVTLPAR